MDIFGLSSPENAGVFKRDSRKPWPVSHTSKRAKSLVSRGQKIDASVLENMLTLALKALLSPSIESGLSGKQLITQIELA
ncbi:MAG TPA: hypothetical protein VMW42_13925 [Desulfatiglandales bacterium]|nr:hypothetical protein [Desulfatiglandales bacterium]